MTTDEIRDEMARLKGWRQAFRHRHASGVEQWCWERDGGDESFVHPMPPTLDGANAAMPEGWFPWERRKGPQDLFWESIHPQWRGGLNPHLCVRVPDTGDPVHDLYALALACVQAEEAKR